MEKRTSRACGLLAIYFFTYLTVEFIVSNHAAELLGTESIASVRSLGLLCTAAGYILYGLLRKRPARGRGYRASMYISLAVSAMAWVGTAVLTGTAGAVAGETALVSLGFAGGAAHERCAGLLQNARRRGLIVGTAVAAAVAAQYAVMFAVPSATARSVAACVTMLIFYAYASRNEPFIVRRTDGSDGSDAPKDSRNSLPAVYIALSAALMTLAVCAGMSAALSSGAQTAIDDGWEKFLFLGGAIAAGALTGFCRRVPAFAAAAAAAALTTAATAMLAWPEAYSASVCAEYFIAGFCAVYVIAAFAAAAPESGNPAMTAGLGAITCALTAASVGALTETFSIFTSVWTAVAVSAAAALIALALAIFYGKRGAARNAD